jgi:hypothetical protein
MVLTCQSAGDFLRFNRHFHSVVLEGGFDERVRFVHISFGNVQNMSEYFHRVVITLFPQEEADQCHFGNQPDQLETF